MNLTNPTEEDYLGLYSIMFWTLTLIGVVKYICIALNADDHGEGGTFAMYSLRCASTPTSASFRPRRYRTPRRRSRAWPRLGRWCSLLRRPSRLRS
ncbi:unnamed protein product [Urochloa humidicola]